MRFLVGTGGGNGNVIHSTALVAELAQWGEVDFWVGGRIGQNYAKWTVPRRVVRAIGPSAGLTYGGETYDGVCLCSLLRWAGREGWRPQYRSPNGQWRSEWNASLDYVREHLGPLRAEPRTHFPVDAKPRGNRVVLAPCAAPRWEGKRWPYWAELAEALGGVTVIGLQHDDIYPWPAGVTNLCGRLSLQEVAQLLSEARLTVSNECGMGHLAVAVGTPTYMLFGPTSPVRSLPPGPHVYCVTAWNRPDCRPCLNHPDPAVRRHFSRSGERCPHGRACLKQLSVDQVLETMAR